MTDFQRRSLPIEGANRMLGLVRDGLKKMLFISYIKLSRRCFLFFLLLPFLQLHGVL